MSRRAYGGTRVNHLDEVKLVHGKGSLAVTVGIDVDFLKIGFSELGQVAAVVCRKWQ